MKFTKDIAVRDQEDRVQLTRNAYVAPKYPELTQLQSSKGSSAIRMEDLAMGISVMRISSSVQVRVVSSVSMIRSITIAISVATVKNSRGDTAGSCWACETRADEGSGAKRVARSAATGALHARRTLATRGAGCACDAGSSVGDVGAVGAGSDRVADGVADDVVVTVLVSGEDDELDMVSR